MTLLPEVEAALMGAAEGRARDARVSMRRRLWRGTPAIAVLLVAGTAALAATEPWRPQLGDSHRLGHPTVSSSALPAAELRLLGVLRRRQTPADRAPNVRAQLRGLVRTVNHGVHVGAIRRLEVQPDGAAVVLVPQERFGDAGPGARGGTVTNALCLLYPVAPGVLRTGGSGEGCWTTAQIRAGKAMNIARGTRGFHTFGLVPDGVARVVVLRRDGTGAEARVHGNFFDVGTTSPYLGPPGHAVRWLNAAGTTIGPPIR